MYLASILPESEVRILQDLCYGLTRTYWVIGDRVNVYLDMIAQPKYVAAGWLPSDVYSGVAELIGKSSRSVRDYAATARVFPADNCWACGRKLSDNWCSWCGHLSENMREHYVILPFAHFRFAARYAEPKAVLEYALRRVDANYGKPPSLDWLEGAVKDFLKPIPPAVEQSVTDTLGAMVGATVLEAVGEGMVADKSAAAYPDGLLLFLRLAKRAVDMLLAQMDDALPISDGNRYSLRNALYQLTDVLTDIECSRSQAGVKAQAQPVSVDIHS